MLMQDYGISESFFKEIDTSIKKNCRTQNDVQAYLFMYQGFSSDLMMLMGNLMQWKFRMPAIFKKALRSMTEKTSRIFGTMDVRVRIQHCFTG